MMQKLPTVMMTAIALCLISACCMAQAPAFPWPQQGSGETLKARFTCPNGFTRLNQSQGSMGHWLRQLPLLAGRNKVLLHNGQLKPNQDAHVAVVDMDVGRRNLQQCADAVMRLRAEYLLAQDRQSDIAFNFTSGHPARWDQWREGRRPKVRGQQVQWPQKASPNGSYENFRRYLDTVFIYAGSASLVRELKRVQKPTQIRPGDVFIQGGYPGHAVMVMDVAENAAGSRVFLLAQSYMPAQQVHILKQPGSSSPWYPAKASGVVQTPEWRFETSDLFRFRD